MKYVLQHVLNVVFHAGFAMPDALCIDDYITALNCMIKCE